MQHKNARLQSCLFCGKTTRRKFCCMWHERLYSCGRRMETRQCKKCGNDFSTIYDCQSYCSLECWNVANDNIYIPKEKVVEKKPPIICAECLKEFIPSGKRNKYCSRECYRKSNSRDNNHLRRTRIKNARKDLGITINKLFERDHGICHICGGLCCKEDYFVTDSGTVIAGNMYPSIDHVIALANGGTHTWDNVSLAHRICNSIKKDNGLAPYPKRLKSRA